MTLSRRREDGDDHARRRALRKGARIARPFVKPGRLINPRGFDPRAAKGAVGRDRERDERRGNCRALAEQPEEKGEEKVGGKEKKVTQVACGWSPAA